jgi:hypothetical protein
MPVGNSASESNLDFDADIAKPEKVTEEKRIVSFCHDKKQKRKGNSNKNKEESA